MRISPYLSKVIIFYRTPSKKTRLNTVLSTLTKSDTTYVPTYATPIPIGTNNMTTLSTPTARTGFIIKGSTSIGRSLPGILIIFSGFSMHAPAYIHGATDGTSGA